MISIFGKRALNHQPLQIFGDGSQTRDFIYVSDAVDATIAALDKNLRSRVLNIASGAETTILELAKTIQRIAKSQSESKLSPPLAGDIARSVADITRARNERDFAPRISLADGLSATIQWLAQKRSGGSPYRINRAIE